MSYKLYDFSDPELDEQIRLVCDVLFNHREVYLGQIQSPTSLSNFFKTREWHSAIFRGGAGGSTSGSTIAASTALCSVSITGSAFVNTAWDTPNIYGTMQTAANVLDSSARIICNHANGQFGQPVHNPYFAFGVKTAAAIANTLIYVGVVDGSANVDPTTANKNLGAGVTALTDWVGFRYDPAGGGTWEAVHRNGTSAATITPVGSAVGTNTAYLLEVYTDNKGVSWKFKINGTLVYTAATNIPVVNNPTGSANSFGEQHISIINTSAGTFRQFRVSRIYGECGGDLTLST